MRGLVILLGITGCGRWGVDPGAQGVGADDGVDATVSAIHPDLCEVADVGDLNLSGVPVSMRAVALSDGFAVLIGTDVGHVYAIRVASDRTLAGQHLPISGSAYVLHGVGQIADRPFLYLDVFNDSYLKGLDPTWDGYGTASTGTAASIDPPFALLPDGLTAMSGTITSGTLELREIDTTGATITTPSVQPTAIAASFTPIPGKIRAAIGRDDGTCETFVIDANTIRDPKTIPSCANPIVTGRSNGHGAVVHTTANQLAVYLIGLDTTLTIGAAADPRIVTIDDEIWLAYQRAGGVALGRVVDAALEEAPVPVAKSPFDLTPTAMFWLDGMRLRTATPCLR